MNIVLYGISYTLISVSLHNFLLYIEITSFWDIYCHHLILLYAYRKAFLFLNGPICACYAVLLNFLFACVEFQPCSVYFQYRYRVNRMTFLKSSVQHFFFGKREIILNLQILVRLRKARCCFNLNKYEWFQCWCKFESCKISDNKIYLRIQQNGRNRCHIMKKQYLIMKYNSYILHSLYS